jgi:translation initiation factor 4E
MSIPPAKINTSNNTLEKTKLKSRYAFWYRISEDIYQPPQKTAIDQKEYENQVIKIAEFETIEDFWAIFQHLRKPDSCRPGIQFQLFRADIKPIWEDINNKNGGKVTIKLRKDFTTIIWEEMIFAIIGDVLPENIKYEINGIVVASRKDFNKLQIWFKNWSKEKNNIIERTIKDLLQIPPEVTLEFEKFFPEETTKK